MIDIDLDLVFVSKCLCRRAVIFKGHGVLGGFYHMPDEFMAAPTSQDEEAAILLGLSLSRRYCFWWSTFEVLRNAFYRLRRLAGTFYFVPRQRRLRPADFKYDCYYCGKKTSQFPHEAEASGKHYPSCCYDCIEKWESIDGECPK